MGNKFILFFLLLISILAKGTTFIPLPIDKQVESADFGAEVILETKDSYKVATGHIYTNYKFKVVEGHGIDEKNLEFPLPGGTLDGVTTAIEGAPKFINGERIFLLLKKVEGKIYLSNFTMGKFSILKMNGDTYYQNEIFPQMKGVGLVKRDQMLSLLESKKSDQKKENKTVYQSETKSNNPPRVVTKKEATRKIASVEEENQETNWGIYVLAFFGIFISLLLIKSRKNEK